MSHRVVLSALSSAGQGDMAWTFLRVNICYHFSGVVAILRYCHYPFLI